MIQKFGDNKDPWHSDCPDFVDHNMLEETSQQKPVQLRVSIDMLVATERPKGIQMCRCTREHIEP